MRKNRQSEIIKQLTDRQLMLNLYFTQLLLLVIAFIGGLFLFDNFKLFLSIFNLNDYKIVTVGASAALIVVIIDLILMKLLPRRFYDDGGINERIFTSCSYGEIFLITVIIASCEEILFRGVIQTHFGLIIASVIFALIHIRYLSNLFLFANVIIISFLIGIIYQVTNNLMVTIVMHFLIDFLLGIYIKFNFNRNNNKSKELKVT